VRHERAKIRNSSDRRGSALIVALWVILLLTILVGGMAFEMKVEANVAGFYRKRVKAQYLAQAGVEWTKAMLNKKVTETLVDGELQVDADDDEDLVRNAYRVQKMGQGFELTRKLGAGQFILNVRPESAKGFNINTLAQQAANDEDARCVLEEILDQAEVPLEVQDELIDCLIDWVDPGDEHRINGAESDDPFYEDRGYEVKNGPLDSVEELLLIKGWTEAIVFGGPPLEEEGPRCPVSTTSSRCGATASSASTTRISFCCWASVILMSWWWRILSGRAWGWTGRPARWMTASRI
jgi:type II secretory pathway component PulK